MWGWETHVHDEEVQPAPCVGEVLDETIRHPLQQHLQDEDVREHLVCVLQHGLHCPPLLNVNVLKGLPKQAVFSQKGLFWCLNPEPPDWSQTPQCPQSEGLFMGINNKRHVSEFTTNDTIGVKEVCCPQRRLLPPSTFSDICTDTCGWIAIGNAHKSKTLEYAHQLTRAPLLSRIMKMMNDSNQLCSTMMKQVFLSVHQLFHQPSSTLTWQHWNLRTQPVGEKNKNCKTAGS